MAASVDYSDGGTSKVYTIPLTEYGGRVSNPIKAGEFLQSFAPLLMPCECTNDAQNSVQEKSAHEKLVLNELTEFTEVPADVIQELYSVCCPDETLYDPEDGLMPGSLPRINQLPSGTSLLCLSYQKAELEKRRSHNYMRYVATKMKYFARSDPEVVHAKKSKELKALSKKPDVTMPNVIYTVRVYKPAQVIEKKISPGDDFCVLGDQELTVLRDSIRCYRDFEYPGEMSANPDAVATAPRAGDRFKSAMFYVEGVLYDDLRDPTSRRYSQPIISWMATRLPKAQAMGVPEQAQMEGVTFADLPIRLGQPYVYMHQGDCEHCIVFTDLRLLHPEDCLYRDAYPLHIVHRATKKINCFVCSDNGAAWLVKNFVLAPQDPSFYCDECFKMFHYDANGKPIGDFQAYAHVDGSSVT